MRGAREIAHRLVRLDDGRLVTRNLDAGRRVYDEQLLRIDGVEHRVWDPMRSKLAAALVKGLKDLDVGADTRILYLGAGQGTTVSHLSDLAPDGSIVAVEFSARAFRKLHEVASTRPNLVAVLADATNPDTFRHFVGAADVLIQDVAQRDQAGIFLKNARTFRARLGLLSVKSRSIDVARELHEIVRDVVARIEGEGHRVTDRVDLAPFEKDHALLRVVFDHAEEA